MQKVVKGCWISFVDLFPQTLQTILYAADDRILISKCDYIFPVV